MISIIIAMSILTLSAIPAEAQNVNENTVAYMVGTIVGGAVTGRPTAYYQRPVTVFAYPEYNMIGGVNPISKGGSLNPNRTMITDKYGRTTEVTTYTDFYGDKHVEVGEY
jgi:hypothetical protein